MVTFMRIYYLRHSSLKISLKSGKVFIKNGFCNKIDKKWKLVIIFSVVNVKTSRF